MCTITGNFERLTVKTEPLTHRVYCALLQTPVLNGLLSRRKNTRFVPYIYASGLHTDDVFRASPRCYEGVWPSRNLISGGSDSDTILSTFPALS